MITFRKEVFEVFEEYKSAATREERLDVLKNMKTTGRSKIFFVDPSTSLWNFYFLLDAHHSLPIKRSRFLYPTEAAQAIWQLH